jgi:ferredoxin-NADP reductase
MLRTLAERPPHTDVVVVHHAPTPERTMFAAELQRLADHHDWLTLHVVHTQTDGARLDEQRLTGLCPDWAERETFVCGPTPLVHFVTEHWSQHHVLDRLHLERFTLDLPDLRDSDATSETVAATFATSTVTAPAPVGTTLLASAEAAGIDAPYGCRSGVCHTCSTRLVSGCTTDVRDGRVSEAGSHVQICVSTPLTDVTLDL